MTSLEQHIWNSIEKEAASASLYSSLLTEAPDPLHLQLLEQAYNNDTAHLRSFKQLYSQLTEETPEYQPHSIQYTSYRNGLLTARKHAHNSAVYYRDVMLTCKDPLVRETFMLAMTQELDLCRQLSILLE